MVEKIIQKYELKTLFNLSSNDFKNKYTNSVLGVFWAIINPFVTIFIYWFVFEYAFKNSAIDDVPYLIWMMAGILPWNFITECLMTTTGSYLEYSYLVKKVVFNKKMIPLIKILSASAIHLFFILILFVFAAGYRVPFTIYTLQLIYYLVCTVAILIPMGRLNAVINIFFRDYVQFVNIFIQAGFWLTPIFWNLNILTDFMLILFKLNPFFYIIQGYRNSLFYHVWFWETPIQTLYFWGFVIILTLVSNSIYNKTEKHFSDVL